MSPALTGFLVANMDVVFFFYALAFLAMGFAILLHVRLRRKSDFKLIDALWLFGWFGLIHGGNELIEMFSLIKGGNLVTRTLGSAVLIVSYLFLFFFGYRLINLARKNFLRIWFPILSLLLFVTFPFSFGANSSLNWAISSRYFLAFPGSLLSALGLLLYYRKEKEQIKNYSAGGYFYLATLTFLIYAFFGGLVVTRSSFFPASLINSNFLFARFGIPVQVFRGLSAISFAWCFRNIVEIFNLEEAEKDAREEELLWESERQFRNVLENLPSGIGISTPDGKIIDSNPKLWEMFGCRTKEEFNLLSFSDLFYDLAERKKFFDELAQKSSTQGFRSRFKRRDGSIFMGAINAVSQTTISWGTQYLFILSET